MVGHILYALNDPKTDYAIADGDVDVDADVEAVFEPLEGLVKRSTYKHPIT